MSETKRGGARPGAGRPLQGTGRKRTAAVMLTPEGWALRERAVEIPGQIGACLPLDPQDAMTLYRLLYRLLAAEDACSEEQARKEAASS